MFTGIIEETGKLRFRENTGKGYAFRIDAKIVLDEIRIGDSIAVNGICLTVTSFDAESFTVDLVDETRSRTRAEQKMKVGTAVNLERAMPVGGRIHGHFVQGHVDTTTSIKRIQDNGGSWEYTFDLEPRWRKFIVEKGSIAVDGVSLTVSACNKEEFRVAVIPHTVRNTIFSLYKTHEEVNLEFDILGKYIINAMTLRNEFPDITIERLSLLGY
jgi:riboflavin synthase